MRRLKPILVTVLALAAMTLPTTAHAAPPTPSDTTCTAYGTLAHFTTGQVARVATNACRVQADTQRCVVTTPALSRPVCSGLAVASARQGVRGWAASPALHELLRRESSGSTNAVNEGSGACGLFQRLPCPWSYSGGGPGPGDDVVHSTALEQAVNGVRYVKGRYGTPDAALAYHDAVGWY